MLHNSQIRPKKLLNNIINYRQCKRFYIKPIAEKIYIKHPKRLAKRLGLKYKIKDLNAGTLFASVSAF